MNILSDKDKKRLQELCIVLQQIKDDSLKDQLVGAAKWAVVNTQPQKTA